MFCIFLLLLRPDIINQKWRSSSSKSPKMALHMQIGTVSPWNGQHPLPGCCNNKDRSPWWFGLCNIVGDILLFTNLYSSPLLYFNPRCISSSGCGRVWHLTTAGIKESDEGHQKIIHACFWVKGKLELAGSIIANKNWVVLSVLPVLGSGHLQRHIRYTHWTWISRLISDHISGSVHISTLATHSIG